MESILTPQNISFVILIASVAFNIFLFFKKPQEAIDKKQAVDKEAVDGKAALLAQQMQWEKEANVAKFKEMQDSIKDATAMAQNHIHTVDTKVDGVLAMIGKMSQEIVKLSTIIEERVPKK